MILGEGIDTSLDDDVGNVDCVEVVVEATSEVVAVVNDEVDVVDIADERKEEGNTTTGGGVTVG